MTPVTRAARTFFRSRRNIGICNATQLELGKKRKVEAGHGHGQGPRSINGDGKVTVKEGLR